MSGEVNLWRESNESGLSPCRLSALQLLPCGRLECYAVSQCYSIQRWGQMMLIAFSLNDLDGDTFSDYIVADGLPVSTPATFAHSYIDVGCVQALIVIFSCTPEN